MEVSALAALQEDPLMMRSLRSGHRWGRNLLLEAEGSFIDGYQRRWRMWEGERRGRRDVWGAFPACDNGSEPLFPSLCFLFSFLAQECKIG